MDIVDEYVLLRFIRNRIIWFSVLPWSCYINYFNEVWRLIREENVYDLWRNFLNDWCLWAYIHELFNCMIHFDVLERTSWLSNVLSVCNLLWLFPWSIHGFYRCVLRYSWHDRRVNIPGTLSKVCLLKLVMVLVDNSFVLSCFSFLMLYTIGRSQIFLRELRIWKMQTHFV